MIYVKGKQSCSVRSIRECLLVGKAKQVTVINNKDNDTRRNDQPPNSQPAKKSTCQKVNLPKSRPKHKMINMLWLLFLETWQADFFEVDNFS